MVGGCKKREYAKSSRLALAEERQPILLQALLVKKSRNKQQQHAENAGVSEPEIVFDSLLS